ncbi:deubiquitinating enzyme [Malassezia pachydermatis]
MATYDISLDTNGTGLAFKEAIAQATSVPTDRQKVMIKGGLLKDDTEISKLNVRAGHQFMVLGAAGELPKAPAKPVQFLEDMQDEELNKAANLRVGLVNLGNTCYLNSTLQVLRTIPPLQEALSAYTGRVGASDGDATLVASMRDLFSDMSKTTEAVPPLIFLTVLRKLAPQFAETAEGGGFAQQDAEEVWVRIMQALSQLPAAGQPREKFVPQYVTGHMTIERSCAETSDEAPTHLEEPFQMLQCNISSSTNEMTAGILESMTQQLEKHSDQLGRTALYNEKRRISRLPAYLSVHFVRFYWRRDINKKTKIMRKVKFPMELDASTFVTDDLARRLAPVSAKIKAIGKDREERAKLRARVQGRSMEAGAVEGGALTDEEEVAQRAKEREQVDALIDADLRSDAGCNPSGLYELVGIVTHKGAAADAGHYMSWVRQEDTSQPLPPPASMWYKFDDDKVSLVPTEKIETLYGGGEDSVAYILLYRAKAL